MGSVDSDESQKNKQEFKKYPIGYIHVNIAEVCTEEGKLYLCVTTDCTSKFAYVELCERQTKNIATDLHILIETLSYKIHTDR